METTNDKPDLSTLTSPITQMADELENGDDGGDGDSPGDDDRLGNCEMSHTDMIWMGTVEMMDKTPGISTSIPSVAGVVGDLVHMSDGPASIESSLTEIGTVHMGDIFTSIPSLVGETDDKITRSDGPASNECSVTEIETVDMVNISTLIPPPADGDNQSEPGNTSTCNEICLTETKTVDKNPCIYTLILPPVDHADSDNHSELGNSESFGTETEIIDKNPDISTLIPPPADMTDHLIHRSDVPAASETSIASETSVTNVGTVNMISTLTSPPADTCSNSLPEPGEICVAVAGTVDQKPGISTLIPKHFDVLVDSNDRSGDGGISAADIGIVNSLDTRNKSNSSSLMSPLNEMTNNLIHEPDGLQSNRITPETATSDHPISGVYADSSLNSMGMNREPVILEHSKFTGSLDTGYTYNVLRLEAPGGIHLQVLEGASDKPGDNETNVPEMETADIVDEKPDIFTLMSAPTEMSDDLIHDPAGRQSNLPSRVANERATPSLLISSLCADSQPSSVNNGYIHVSGMGIKREPVEASNRDDDGQMDDMAGEDCSSDIHRDQGVTPAKRIKIERNTDDESPARLSSRHLTSGAILRRKPSYSEEGFLSSSSEDGDDDPDNSGDSNWTEQDDIKHVISRNKTRWKFKVNTSPHITTHSDERPYQCTTCDKSFETKWGLTRHIKTHLPKPPRYKESDAIYGCSTCGANFVHVRVLKGHIRANEGHIPKHQCPRCERFFSREIHLQRHIEVHDNGHPFKCDQCNFSTEYAPSFKRHVANHAPVYDQPCPKCNKLFKCKTDVRRHVETVHVNMPNLLCTVCGKALKSKKGLDAHMLALHSDEKPHECTECGKWYSTRSQLTNHAKTHGSMDKCMQCFICGKGFFFSYRLETHMLCHTDDMPFKCEHCGKEFKRQHNLDSHMRTHVGLWSFTCHICDRSFRWNHILRNHLKTHVKIENVE